MSFAPQRRALFRHPNLQKWREHVVFCTFWLGNVLRATTACTFSTSQLPKVVRSWCALYILTWKCASRHNGVHFLDISTSKSGPRMVCFVHFDFEMCFAPQRRALFRHCNFQKWSDAEVFCIFSLGNVLRATTACKFSSLIWPHGSAPAALASLLFDPPQPQIIGKTTVNCDFSTFSRTCIFFLLTLSLLWSSLFCSSLLWLFPSLLFSCTEMLFHHVSPRNSGETIHQLYINQENCLVTVRLMISAQNRQWSSHFSSMKFMIQNSHMGVSINGGPPIAGWFMENPNYKWMRTRGSPIRKLPYIELVAMVYSPW